MPHRSMYLALALTAALPAATLASPADIAGSTDVRGTVLRPDGAPLAGAQVELVPLRSNFDTEAALLAARHGDSPTVTAETDAAGRFLLDGPGLGVWQVRVDAPAMLSMRHVLLPLANPVELPPVALWPAVEARIEVVDGDRQPVAGAGIYAQSRSSEAWRQPSEGAWRPALRLGWTDARGRLSLPRARGERLDVWAHLGGQLATAHAAGVREATLTLEPVVAASSTLEAREPTGVPTARAIVAFGATSWPLGITSDRGTLALHGPAPEPLTLRLLTADGRSQTMEYAPSAGQTRFTLPSPIAVTGRIRDPVGSPIAGALIWPIQDPGSFTRSGEDGRYQLLTNAGDSLVVQAHAPGFVPRSRKIPPPASSTPQATASRTFDLVLLPAAALTGRVLDEAGRVIAGVQLEAVARSERPPAIRSDQADSRSVTDAGGGFTLANLVPDTTYAVTARKPGLGAAELLVPPGAQGPLGIVLRRGRLAFGRVLDMDERPLAGVEVALRAAGASAATQIRPDAEAGAGSSAQIAPSTPTAPTGTTDAEGRFEIRTALSRTVNLVARGNGFAPLVVRGIQVPPGDGPVDLGSLYLELGVTIRGRVTGADGRAVPGASVWVLPGPEEGRRMRLAGGVERSPDATADARGRFRIEGLERRRTVGLYADGQGFLPATVWGLEPPMSQPAEVVLQPAAQIRGQVTDEAGEPIAGAEITLHPVATPAAEAGDEPEPFERLSRSARSDQEGRFELEDAAPGRVEIEAFARGFVPPPTRALEITLDQDISDLRFVLVRGAVLEGQVTTASFEPIAGARVALGRPEGLSDEDGRYRVEGVALGSQVVAVRHPGYTELHRELEIDPGVSTADFVLDGGHRVTGRVVDAAGLPLAEVALELEPAGDEAGWASARSDAAGDFRLEPVADGSYRVRAHRRGYVELNPDEAIRVAGGPVESLEIRLGAGARLEGRILGLEFEDLARVGVWAESEGRRHAGEVDFEGAYRIDDLAADDWTVRARLAGGQREASSRVVVEPGAAVVQRDLEFGRGVVLSGLVLFGGEPLAGADVEVRRQPAVGRRQVVTDPEGLFRIEDLEPGHYRLSLASRREQLVHNQDVALASDRDLVIEISPGALAGQVTDAATGDGIGGALVALKHLLADGREGSLTTVAADDEGRFHQARLTSGRYRLSVLHNGYQPAELAVEVAPGTVVDDLRVMLHTADGLDVSVRLASSRTPRYITVRGQDASGRTFSETRPTWGDGDTRFATFPRGRWRLLVGADGAATVEQHVEVPGEPLAVVLPDAGRLRVRVPALVETDTVATLEILGGSGQPFRHLAWGGELQQAWPLVGGRATVDGLPAGVWTLQVRSAGGTFSGVAATTGGPDVEVSLE